MHIKKATLKANTEYQALGKLSSGYGSTYHSFYSFETDRAGNMFNFNNFNNNGISYEKSGIDIQDIVILFDLTNNSIIYKASDDAWKTFKELGGGKVKETLNQSPVHQKKNSNQKTEKQQSTKKPWWKIW